MPTNQIDIGISELSRRLASPGQYTVQPGFQMLGNHMATVVDDIDEMSMSRVWVYIPGVSAHNPNIQIARYSPARNPPASDGTPGTPIESMRQGFIRAFPLSPTAGSDRLRESPNTPDGRNPGNGQSNGYGMHSQARNGDQLCVSFMNGDPSRCFIVGHVPKTAETDHVPSYGPQQNTNASGTGYSTASGPGYNTGVDTTQVISTVAFNNATDAGLISDNLRGPGSSSSIRETPSRVWGVKTPGDPDTNMMGHQLVMDDHPNSQLMRLRTSKGAQILLCDNGDFIYLSTATGKSWLQIDDSGNVNVFAFSSVSFHATQDFNLSCDRDFNLNCGGNFNAVVSGDTRWRMAGGGNITVGESGGDLDITTINNMMFKVQGEFRLGAQTGISQISQQFLSLQSAQNMTMKSAKDLDMQTTGGDFNLKTSGKVNQKSGGDFNTDTGGNMNATKNSLTINDITDLNTPVQADIPVLHSVTGAPQTSGPPTAPTQMINTAAPIVPQHEPWPGHPAGNPGFNASVNPASVPNLVNI